MSFLCACKALWVALCLNCAKQISSPCLSSRRWTSPLSSLKLFFFARLSRTNNRPCVLSAAAWSSGWGRLPAACVLQTLSCGDQRVICWWILFIIYYHFIITLRCWLAPHSQSESSITASNLLKLNCSYQVLLKFSWYSRQLSFLRHSINCFCSWPVHLALPPHLLRKNPPSTVLNANEFFVLGLCWPCVFFGWAICKYEN